MHDPTSIHGHENVREMHRYTGYERFANLKTYLGAFGGLGANPTHSMELE
jgi:hypothetical protein